MKLSVLTAQINWTDHCLNCHYICSFYSSRDLTDSYDPIFMSSFNFLCDDAKKFESGRNGSGLLEKHCESLVFVNGASFGSSASESVYRNKQ